MKRYRAVRRTYKHVGRRYKLSGYRKPTSESHWSRDALRRMLDAVNPDGHGCFELWMLPDNVMETDGKLTIPYHAAEQDKIIERRLEIIGPVDAMQAALDEMQPNAGKPGERGLFQLHHVHDLPKSSFTGTRDTDDDALLQRHQAHTEIARRIQHDTSEAGDTGAGI